MLVRDTVRRVLRTQLELWGYQGYSYIHIHSYTHSLMYLVAVFRRVFFWRWPPTCPRMYHTFRSLANPSVILDVSAFACYPAFLLHDAIFLGSDVYLLQISPPSSNQHDNVTLQKVHT